MSSISSYPAALTEPQMETIHGVHDAVHSHVDSHLFPLPGKFQPQAPRTLLTLHRRRRRRRWRKSTSCSRKTAPSGRSRTGRRRGLGPSSTATWRRARCLRTLTARRRRRALRRWTSAAGWGRLTGRISIVISFDQFPCHNGALTGNLGPALTSACRCGDSFTSAPSVFITLMLDRQP